MTDTKPADAQPTPIQRYSEMFGGLTSDEKGEWIRYTDYEPFLSTVQAELTKARLSINDNFVLYRSKCSALAAKEAELAAANTDKMQWVEQATQEHDIRTDLESMLALVAEALSVANEPHQTFNERLLEAAQSERTLRKQAERRLAEVQTNHSWNVEELPNGDLSICKGLHDRVLGCKYVRYVRAEQAEQAERRVAAVEADLVAMTSARDYEKAAHQRTIEYYSKQVRSLQSLSQRALGSLRSFDARLAEHIENSEAALSKIETGVQDAVRRHGTRC